MEWTHCANCGKKLVDLQTGYCSGLCETEYAQHKNSAKTPVLHIVPNPDEAYNGVYEHITDYPIKITGGKAELKAVCEKHGVMAKALLKPRSQGKGYEMR